MENFHLFGSNFVAKKIFENRKKMQKFFEIFENFYKCRFLAGNANGVAIYKGSEKKKAFLKKNENFFF